MSHRQPPGRLPHTHQPGPRQNWWRRHWKAITGFISAVAVASVSPLIVDAIRGATNKVVTNVVTRGGKPPFALTTQVDAPEDAGCRTFAFSSNVRVSVPSPTEEDLHEWATRQGGVTADTTTIRLTLQGRSTDSVVLHAIRVGVDARRQARGTAYFPHAVGGGCAGIPQRRFTVNLDSPQPSAVPSAGYDGSAVDFPYRISSTEPEVIVVQVDTEKCDCSFHLDLDWTSGEREGTLRIRDGKQPFRVIGSQQLPFFQLDTNGHWTPSG
ncbi:hypothetical protein [Streptomyces sp. NPDC005209]|uniref:hypothetical protein n=1 Tax=Streptomyces sp. NPDC005209 TaxID=3156715 RepID=UPI00339EC280